MTGENQSDRRPDENIVPEQGADFAEKLAALESKLERQKLDYEMEKVSKDGVKIAKERIKEGFEDQEEEKKNLPFHNRKHTEGVMRRTEEILLAIQKIDPALVSNRDIIIARLCSAFHDTVQDWVPDEIVEKEGDFKGLTKVRRKRNSGKNEWASGDELKAFMAQVNQAQKKEVFTQKDIDMAGFAIDATVADVWDGANGTISQRSLTKKETPIIAAALALSDIGVAGMDGGEKFVPEGKALFREDNLDILEAVRNQKEVPITDASKKYFTQRMVGYLKSQIGFASGRQKRLSQELESLPQQARESVAALFDKFQSSVDESIIAADEAGGMKFDELVKFMGY